HTVSDVSTEPQQKFIESMANVDHPHQLSALLLYAQEGRRRNQSRTNRFLCAVINIILIPLFKTLCVSKTACAIHAVVMIQKFLAIIAYRMFVLFCRQNQL